MAREILHRTDADARRVPWRNGRGVTEELAIWPAAATFERGDFAWRIARARVDVAGPFSAFPGYERILVVTEGAGLVLSHGAHARRARLWPFEPYRFDGGWETSAELVAGPVADWNVLARRGSATAQVEVARLGARRTREVVGPGHAFVHAIGGSAVVRVPREEEPIRLEPGESVWARELSGEEELEIAGTATDTRILIARIAVPGSGRG